MKKYTFTIFCDDDSVYGYLFDVTRLEAQAIVSKMNEERKSHYYMEGYWE